MITKESYSASYGGYCLALSPTEARRVLRSLTEELRDVMTEREALIQQMQTPQPMYLWWIGDKTAAALEVAEYRWQMADPFGLLPTRRRRW